MRIWFREFKDTRMIRDTVVEDYTDLNRTRKIFNAIETACSQFDLSVPIWLDANIEDFKRHSRVKFRADNFMEAIEFDFLDVQVIEE